LHALQGRSINVLSYKRLDPDTVTIGAIITGTSYGEKGVYIRGGLVYRFRCNSPPTLHIANYTNGPEVFPSPVDIDNWAGTAASTLWTYAKGGPYSNEAVQAERINIVGTAASTNPETGALTVAGGVGIAGRLNVEGRIGTSGALTVAGAASITGALTVAGATSITGALTLEKDLSVKGPIAPNKGIFNTWYWGNATRRSQATWFSNFENLIPIGKRLTVYGGARLCNTSGEWSDNVLAFIERLDNDTIEINAFPINMTHTAMITIIPCTRGNLAIVSESCYFGW
jgi:hypothetical protein